MAFPIKGRFTSKLQGMNSSKKIHMCTGCLHNELRNWGNDPCPGCGTKDSRQMFSSRVEQKRGAALCLAQARGEISNLKFQPRYPLVVEGEKITTYIADASYLDNATGRAVVEDVKPMGDFMDTLAKIKIALFNALYKNQGLTVTIIRKG